jgi:exonuclease VII small subunit
MTPTINVDESAITVGSDLISFTDEQNIQELQHIITEKEEIINNLERVMEKYEANVRELSSLYSRTN